MWRHRRRGVIGPCSSETIFRRDRDAAGTNALLNYGYAIARAGVARAIMAAGLHPSLGLAHANRGNAFCLVDDCLEPFRPIVDLLVFDLVEEGIVELDSAAKQALARVLIKDMLTVNGASPVALCMERLAVSLARCFFGRGNETRFAASSFAAGALESDDAPATGTERVPDYVALCHV